MCKNGRSGAFMTCERCVPAGVVAQTQKLTNDRFQLRYVEQNQRKGASPFAYYGKSLTWHSDSPSYPFLRITEVCMAWW
jgi:hypothetical protein